MRFLLKLKRGFVSAQCCCDVDGYRSEELPTQRAVFSSSISVCISEPCLSYSSTLRPLYETVIRSQGDF